MKPDFSLLRSAMGCLCPRCHKGALYQSGFSIELNTCCESCGLDFTKNDSADGPAVFLIFILGAFLVPAALLFEFTFSPPLWVHGVLWLVIALGLTVGALRPLKSYIIALQFKHRPSDWGV